MADDRTMRQWGKCEWCGAKKKNWLGMCGSCCRFPVRTAAKQERG